jgi:hypothetical protein
MDRGGRRRRPQPAREPCIELEGGAVVKRLLAVMLVSLVFGVPLLVVLGWRVSAVLLAAWLGVLTIAVLVAKAFDLVRERDELEIDNHSMRQRLTVARALVEPFLDDRAGPGGELDAWIRLAREWMRNEDRDPQALLMEARAKRLKAQRELDAIRS